MVGHALDLTEQDNYWRSNLKPETIRSFLRGFSVISVVEKITAEDTDELMVKWFIVIWLAKPLI